MKKIICIALNAALALSLCACANSDGTISGTDSEGSAPFVEASDPFAETPSETESGGTDSGEDDGYNHIREMNPEVFTEDYIDYMKQSNSGASYDKWQVNVDGESYGEEGPVTYRGGEVEISFTAKMHTQGREWSNGYLVYVGCTPQTISLNSAENEVSCSDIYMAVDKGSSGETREYSIRFTPRLTQKNFAEKDDLKLTLITIDNPLFLTYGTVEHFDFEHRMTVLSQRPFKLEGSCEATELVPGKSFEYFPEKDTEVYKYLYESLRETGEMVRFQLCSETKEKPVIKDGKADITLVLYGGDGKKSGSFKVYFYVNHERVRIDDGCDYITAELKEGLVAKYTTTLENLKPGDFVYAIAIAEDDLRLSREEWAMKTDTRRLWAAD